jgi:hypothetical protein
MAMPSLASVRKLALGALALGAFVGFAAVTATGCASDAPTEPCSTPEAIEGKHGATGFVRCGDGAINLASAAACHPPPRACQRTEDALRCTSDSGCNKGSACISLIDADGTTACDCAPASECGTDADCGEGRVCLCGEATSAFFSDDSSGASGGVPNTCVPASCRGAGDCDGGQCGLSFVTNGCKGIFKVACRTADDTCRNDEVCSKSGEWGGSCGPKAADGPFVCNPENCTF